MAAKPHSVAMVAFADAQILDVVGPLEVFSRAARILSDEGRKGPQLARNVARELVLFLKRPGGQSQFSANLSVQMSDRAPLAELQAWMADHVAADLSVEALARRVSMSSRNFARVFARSAGATPARYVERLRVEAARRRLEETRNNVDAIAAQCGFGTAESMRRSFQRTLRVSPTSYRSRFEARPA